MCSCYTLDVSVEDNLMLLRRDRAQLELNHRLIQFGIANTTLAWKFVPDSVRANCSTSHVVSFRECQQNNVELNRTTEDETITLSSTSLQQSGMLLDLNLSSSAGSHLEQCPRLMDTVRVNGNITLYMYFMAHYTILKILQYSHLSMW